MQRDEIRLECLKLAHRHDRSAKDVITTASEYEKYVVSDVEVPEKKVEPDKRKPGRPSKKLEGENSDFLT